MNGMHKHTRWISAVALSAVLATSLAPAARADRGRREWGGDRPVYRTRVVNRDYHPGSTYIVRRSSAGPAIAGFLGGLFLGAALANSAPAGYEYYDPYCHESFVSLGVYRAHALRHHHYGIVRVIAVDDGRCVGSYRYWDGGWHRWNDGYRDRPGDGRDWDDD